MIKLTDEQSAAIQEHPEGVSCEDTRTQRVYWLVEEQVHQRAMQALKQQQDLDAIRQGLTQMKSSAGTPVQEAREQLAQELGFSVGAITID